MTLTCSWLSACSGYYRYDEGFRPSSRARSEFAGEIVHPQHWPEDLDVTGKRVVVIGSGATAVTLVPSLADDAGHVTMLQRTPSYILSLPGRDPLAQRLRSRLPAKVAYPIVRWKNVLLSTLLFQLSRRRPALVKKLIRRLTQKQLPEGFDVDTHFNPPYNPWDQRLCLVPDGDLFRTLRRGEASIVTDRIARFTERGIELESGEPLDADVDHHRDRAQPAPARRHDAVDRRRAGRRLEDGLLQGDDDLRRPQLHDGDRLHERLLDAQGRPGQPLRLPAAQPPRRQRLRRPPPRWPRPRGPTRRSSTSPRATCSAASSSCPSRAARTPWRLHQNYIRDVRLMRRGPLEDEGMTFQRPAPSAGAERTAA